MSKTNLIPAVLLLAAVLGPAAAADARSDLRVEQDRDQDRNLIYELVNVGDRNVRAIVSHGKTCNSTTTRRKPSEREYRLGPKARTRLRKVMDGSDCSHEYRIVRAEYY